MCEQNLKSGDSLHESLLLHLCVFFFLLGPLLSHSDQPGIGTNDSHGFVHAVFLLVFSDGPSIDTSDGLPDWHHVSLHLGGQLAGISLTPKDNSMHYSSNKTCRYSWKHLYEDPEKDSLEQSMHGQHMHVHLGTSDGQ